MLGFVEVRLIAIKSHLKAVIQKHGESYADKNDLKLLNRAIWDIIRWDYCA